MTKLDIRAGNRLITEILAFFLNLTPDTVDLDAVKSIAKESDVDLSYAYAEYMAALCGLDTLKKDRTFFRQYFVPMIHELLPQPYLQNPYYQNIQIPSKKIGKWELKQEMLSPGEAFVFDDFKVMPDGRLIPQIGFFTEPFSFPAILENDREWMTLMPNEITTSQEAVEKAHGHVLTFGLGLGYFLYMASEKSNVKSVTAVEISQDAANLFRTYILPQFPHKEKIHVILDDAYHFADTKLGNNHYDFLFADIWHDVGDGQHQYLRMKEYEKKHPNIDFVYWLEKSILCYMDESLW